MMPPTIWRDQEDGFSGRLNEHITLDYDIPGQLCYAEYKLYEYFCKTVAEGHKTGFLGTPRNWNWAAWRSRDGRGKSRPPVWSLHHHHHDAYGTTAYWVALMFFGPNAKKPVSLLTLMFVGKASRNKCYGYWVNMMYQMLLAEQQPPSCFVMFMATCLSSGAKRPALISFGGVIIIKRINNCPARLSHTYNARKLSQVILKLPVLCKVYHIFPWSNSANRSERISVSIVIWNSHKVEVRQAVLMSVLVTLIRIFSVATKVFVLSISSKVIYSIYFISKQSNIHWTDRSTDLKSYHRSHWKWLGS